MSDGEDATAPRFQWRRRDDSGWGWGLTHTTVGPCTSCPGGTPEECPHCGGRLHQEPVFDGGIGRSDFCQQERTDRGGGRTRMRAAPSVAQIRAGLQAKADRREQMLDRAIQGVLAVKVTLFVLFAAVVVVSFVYTIVTT